jgi:hypothetical protein
MSRVERAVTYVGLEIIGKLAEVLGWTRSSSSGDQLDPVLGKNPTDPSQFRSLLIIQIPEGLACTGPDSRFTDEVGRGRRQLWRSDAGAYWLA